MNSKKPTRSDQTRQLIRAPVLLRPKMRLEVVSGPDKGKSAESGDQLLHIGTQAGTTLRLSDPAVSRIHVQLINADGTVQLRDVGSTNGSWIDRVRLRNAEIPSGTVITLGRSKVRIVALDERVSESLSEENLYGEMVGRSAAMRAVFARLERLAPTDQTVLITGETGTGKELCARSIVQHSSRSEGPLVVVDCGSIAPNLLESELFGHERGAFTNAEQSYAGAFERAHGGTLFLDELGELPLAYQTRLLRAVETHSVRRIGGARDIPLDLRILAATNRCLEEEVNRGTFRTDLYFRLAAVQVRLPPLRERADDIDLLARSLLADLAPTQTFEEVVSSEQLEQLKRHSWPGNVRELRNQLLRLTLGDDPAEGLAVGGLASPQATLFDADFSRSFKDAKEQMVQRFERAYLEALMDKSGGNISEAARVAQTDRNYLTRLLRKHQLHPTT